MANPVKGEVPLEVAGRHFILVLNTYALASVERRLKMSWPRMIQNAANNGFGVDESLALFHASLLKYHKDVTEEQVAGFMDEMGFEKVSQVLVEVINLMAPKKDGGQGVPNPPQVTTNGTGTTASPSG